MPRHPGLSDYFAIPSFLAAYPRRTLVWTESGELVPKTNPAGPPGIREVAAAIGSVLEALLALALSSVVFLNTFNVAGCGPSPYHRCDLNLAQASIYITPVGGLLGVLATLILALLPPNRGRPLWSAFVLGTGFILLAFAVAIVLNNVSLQS